MILTGNPAELIGTNFSGRNTMFIWDLANHRYGARGKWSGELTGLGHDASTNIVVIPDPTRTK
jgi:hypothetical protein